MRAIVVPLLTALVLTSPAHAASLAGALKTMALPQIVSTDALDRTLPAVVVQKSGAVGLFESSAEDAQALVPPAVGGAAAVQAKLAQILKKEGGTSAALFLDTEAPGEAIGLALAAADKAGASSYSIAVHGLRAVRAPRPPVCETTDALADRCAEVRYAISAGGTVVSAADLDVGVEGCEPVSATAPKRKGPRAAWDGVVLQGEDGKCPIAPEAFKALYHTVAGKVGDCSRAKVTVEPGATGLEVTALVKALRETGVDAVSVVQGKKASVCTGAAPLASLDVGLPAGKKLVVEGELSPGDVRAALAERQDALRKCYVDVAGKKGKGGTLMVSITVAADGKVASVARAKGGDVEDPKVDACVAAVVQSAVFKAGKLPSAVTYPVVFTGR
jgi:hypothetical protein